MTLPLRARLYLYAVLTIAGAALVAAGLALAAGAPVSAGLLSAGEVAVVGQLVLLAVLAQHFPLAFGPKRRFDLSIALHFAVVLTVSPPVAVILAAIGEGVGQGTLMLRRSRETGKRMRGPQGVLFNTSQMVLAVSAAATVRTATLAVTNASGGADSGEAAAREAIFAALCGLLLYLVNTALVAVMVALHQRRNAWQVWRDGRAWNAVQAGSLLVLGYVTAQAAQHEPWVPALMLAPAALTYASLRRTAQAEAAIQARDEFLSLASHELRTPLTSLRGYAQLLRERFSDVQTLPGAQGSYVPRALETIDRQSQRLCSLIEQLLDVSRVQSGKLVLDRQRVDLAELARDVATSMQVIVPEYRLVVHAGQPVELMADRLRLEQVLTNLIANAARHAGGGDRIEIEAGLAANRQALLAVRDYGQGVPSEHRGRIFDRYYQAQSGHTSSGLGVGLYITREIVERHGGRIVLESPAGGGARFVITLPAASTPTGANAASPTAHAPDGAPMVSRAAAG